MIKLGEIKNNRWERISFKEWIKRGLASVGKYSVRVVFPPNRYPTFTVVFEDPVHAMEVRVNIKADKMREVFKALGLPFRKTDLPALVFEISEIDDGGLVYGLDIDQDNFYLSWKGTHWIRRRKEDLDIGL